MAEVYAAERTRQGIAALENGDISGARTLLAEALALDPEYELAWLWFAACTEDDGEKKFCLERAKELNPLQEASAALGPLRGVDKKTPPELRAIVDPPPPEFVRGYVPELRKARRRRIILRAVAAAAVLALVGGLVWAVNLFRSDTQYIAVVVGENDDGADSAQEIINSAQWAIDSWNESGRMGSHTLAMKVFHDHNDPTTAKQVAQQIVDDGRFLGVIGHYLSTTSEAASPVYKAGKMPVITATATADALSRNNPYYFRTVFNSTMEGTGIAAYVTSVMQAKKSIIVYSDDAVDRDLRAAYVKSIKASGGDVQAEIMTPTWPTSVDTYLDEVADKISKVSDPGPIILATMDANIGKLGPKLREKDIKAKLVGADSLATDEFFNRLRGSGSSVINDAIAAAPLVQGTLTGEAVRFYNDYQAKYGYRPFWSAGLVYDAVDAFAHAMTEQSLGFTSGSRAEDREKIRARFDHARTVQTSIPGLTGAIYFNADDAAVRPVAFESGRITPSGQLYIESAQSQLAPYSPQAGVPLADALKNGEAVKFLDSVYTIQNVVSVGVNVNEIDELDAASQTFNANFFIWFKYGPGVHEATDVVFPNAVDSSLSIGEPQRKETVGGQTYELYQVRGNFKTQMEFADFPFDRQILPITVQNRTLPAARMSYVPDVDVVDQSQESRLESGVDSGSTIDQIPNWVADAVYFVPNSVGNTGGLGDPFFTGGTTGITYSQMLTTIEISRDVPSFLVKNMLPLLLLAIVVYVSLWMSHKDTTSRVSFGVTGILTGAVMLNTVTSSLPSVDYTVAIEWAYYAFIALAGSAIVVTLVGRHLTDSRKLAAVRVLDVSARIAYPLVILAIAALYWFAFSGR